MDFFALLNTWFNSAALGDDTNCPGQCVVGGANREFQEPTTCIYCQDGVPYGQPGADQFFSCATENNCHPSAGLGCLACLDDPANWIFYGAPDQGVRFLMRWFQWTPGALPYSSRDAWGKVHDLESNNAEGTKARLVPLQTTYLLAPVHNSGTQEECLNDACSWTWLHWTVPGNSRGTCANCRCAQGEAIGDFVKRKYADCNFYAGHNRPHWTQNYWARKAPERNTPRLVEVKDWTNNKYKHSVFFRSGYTDCQELPGVADVVCKDVGNCATSNALVGALSRVFRDGTNCEASYGLDTLVDGVTWAHDFYNEEQGIGRRNRFHRLFFEVRDLTITNEDEPPVVQLKNALIANIFEQQLGNVNFEQLDLKNFDGDVIDEWTRSFTSEHNNNGQPFNPLNNVPAIYARVRPSDGTLHPITIGIEHASVELHLIAHKVNRFFNTARLDGYKAYIQPHVTLKIYIRPHYSLVNQIEGSFVRLWMDKNDPTRTVHWLLKNDRELNANLAIPKIESSFADASVEFVSIHNGREYIVDLPNSVVWWGQMNSFTKPSSIDQEFFILDRGVTNNVYWGALAEGFKNITVPGQATHIDSYPDSPNQIYKGLCTFSFPN